MSNTDDGMPRLINYAGEKARYLVWQDAALTALGALITARPPNGDEIEQAPAGVAQYAKEIVRAAYAIADEAFKQHGPSVDGRLQKENPFVAAPGVKDDDAAEDDNDAGAD